MSKKPALMVDGNTGNSIQSHITDPNKCLGLKNANTVFKRGDGGDVDITGWTTIVLYPSADGQVAYNGNAALIEPIFSGQPNVFVLHPSVTQISPNVACTVVGM